MNFASYASIWRLPPVRHAILLGALGKAPWFGAGVVLTLHVVQGLGESYASAGILTAVFTIAIALASPLRGRMLDTYGLRRTLLPSLILLPAAFLAAPFLGYGALLASMGAVGFLAIPWSVLTRQLVLASVPDEQRRTALALDSVVTEVAFMAGPTLGILLATTWNTGWTLTLLALLSVAAGVILAVLNPPLVSESDATPDEPSDPGVTPRTRWLNGPVVGTFIVMLATAFTLSGTDLAMVASARSVGDASSLALLIVTWGAGSIVGGLIFGGLPRGGIGQMPLLVGLALTTMLVALAHDVWTLAALLALAGLFCAPSLAAASERLGDLVPPERRGEAFGWFGTWATAGNALAPPIIGYLLDGSGWRAGYLATGLTALALAAAGWLALQVGRRGVRRHRARRNTPAAPATPRTRSAQEELPQAQ